MKSCAELILYFTTGGNFPEGQNDFVDDVIRKAKEYGSMTDKQREVLTKIMMGSGGDRKALIARMDINRDRWEGNDFYESCYGQYQKKRYLTDKQFACLEKLFQ